MTAHDLPSVRSSLLLWWVYIYDMAMEAVARGYMWQEQAAS